MMPHISSGRVEVRQDDPVTTPGGSPGPGPGSRGGAPRRVDARPDPADPEPPDWFTQHLSQPTTALPRPSRPPEPSVRRNPDPNDELAADPTYADQYDTEPLARPQTRTRTPRGAHLPPYSEPLARTPKAPVDPAAATGGRSPRKLTVTRVAALRSRELTSRGVLLFRRAASADGADQSGLTHLTYAVMGNYAVDAAMMVGLANTIFFADTGSTGKVLLYLLITVAPFALIAPLIGPLLDRLERGRRMALALSSFARALLAVLMALHFNPFNPWVIYPCALGELVLSKAFSVLKAALTPRVLPPQITLVKTNSRLTVFGLVAGGVAGAIAAGMLKMFGSPGALWFTAACAVGGGVLCLRIPAWVESTEGEVPVRHVTNRRGGFPLMVTVALWANSMIRVETGFLALFMAFVIKNQHPSGTGGTFTQLLLLGIIGLAAGAGGFLGNALGARLNLAAPEVLSIICLGATLVSTVIAAVLPGLPTAAIVGLVGSTASSLAKVCLDSVMQHQLPEVSRASAFGRSESVLQLAWVSGGVVGLLIGGVWFAHLGGVYLIGFATVSLILALGLVQCLLRRAGKSLLPRFHSAPGPTVAGSPAPNRTMRSGRRAGSRRPRTGKGTLG